MIYYYTKSEMKELNDAIDAFERLDRLDEKLKLEREMLSDGQ